jgi:phosphatidylglycerol:prolipoprotein diacylglycerol transferase
MYPSPILIPGYGFIGVRPAFALVAAVIGGALTIWLAKRRLGLSPWRVTIALLVIIFCALGAARGHFILAHPAMYPTLNAQVVNVTNLLGPQHAIGAVLGTAAGLWIATSLLGVSLGKLADIIVAPAGIAYAVVRVGCFAQGCCGGSICFYPWCMAWPPGSPIFATHVNAGVILEQASQSMWVHPLQIYFVLMGLGLSLGAQWFFRRKRYDGEVAVAALTWFAGWSAVLETFRADSSARPYVGGQPSLLWAALLVFVVALTGLLLGRIRPRLNHPTLARDSGSTQ